MARFALKSSAGGIAGHRRARAVHGRARGTFPGCCRGMDAMLLPLAVRGISAGRAGMAVRGLAGVAVQRRHARLRADRRRALPAARAQPLGRTPSCRQSPSTAPQPAPPAFARSKRRDMISRTPRGRSKRATSSWRMAGHICKVSTDFYRQLCCNENNFPRCAGVRGGSDGAPRNGILGGETDEKFFDSFVRAHPRPARAGGARRCLSRLCRPICGRCSACPDEL